MTRDKIVEKLRASIDSIDVSNVDFLAVQVTLTDVDPNIFYIEIKDHKMSVEPYDYHDRSCAFTISSTNFNAMLNGKLNATTAFLTGKLKIDGDIGKAKELGDILKQARKNKK